MVRGFLRNHKSENYVELVETLVKNYGKMDCKISLKVYILDAHLDEFKKMACMKEEDCDILDFGRRYQESYSIMGDYILVEADS